MHPEPRVCVQNLVYASRTSCMRPESRVCVQNLVYASRISCIVKNLSIVNFQIKASMQSAFNSMSNNVRNNSATKNSMVNRRHVQQCNASSPTRHVVKNIVKKKLRVCVNFQITASTRASGGQSVFDSVYNSGASRQRRQNGESQ